MRCQEHNRTHCPEPRCHVLAVCLVEVPTACDRDAVGSLAGWSRQYGYVWRPPNRCTYDDTRVKLAEQIAARLVAWMRWDGVAWMRWDGALPCEACEGSGTIHGLVGSDTCDFCSGTGRWAGGHPLDAVMTHADRIKALVCRVCQDEGDGKGNLVHLRPPLRGGIGPIQETPCDHGGVHWATVAVLLDRMQELGIGLGVVHKWRPIDLDYLHKRVASVLSLPMSDPLRGRMYDDVASIVHLRLQIQLAGGLSDDQMSRVVAGICEVAQRGGASLRECHESALQDVQQQGTPGALWWAARSPEFGAGPA